MKLLSLHEVNYIRSKGTLENRVSPDAYVPKEIWIEDTRYVFFVEDDYVQVISRMADKSTCLHGPEDWIV